MAANHSISWAVPPISMEISNPLKRWSVSTGNADIEAEFIQQLSISPVIARLLVNRGICDVKEAGIFLNPNLQYSHDPFLLPDCEKAANRIAQAVRNHEIIFVHGDYDVDGMTSCAIWTRMLRRVGAEVIPHVPHRLKHGYGVHAHAVDMASEKGAKLIITCDCGIQAHEVVEYAKEKQIDVVITDHHEAGDILPQAVAVVNPHRNDSQYPFTELAGVGVSYKVAEAVVKTLGLPTDAFQRAFLDLVTLGTVADVVPLLGENRLIVANGLPRLSESRKAGVRALLDLCGLSHGGTKKLSTDEIGYRIGPRLNAAGRIDDAAIALQLLLTDDPGEAKLLAEKLEIQNEERKKEQERIYKEAEASALEQDMSQVKVLLVAGDNWHTGVIGIVAGNLAKRFTRPTLVVSIDPETGIGKGSARSIGTFNIHDAIHSNRDLFLNCGGHAMAAGFSLKKEMLPTIREALTIYASKVLTEEDLLPVVKIDMEIEGIDADLGLCDQLSMLAPYGFANEAPVFLSRHVLILSKNITKDGKHVQLQLRSEGMNPTKAIAFNQSETFETLEQGDEIDVVYTPDIDTWNGRRQLQWAVTDARKTEET